MTTSNTKSNMKIAIANLEYEYSSQKGDTCNKFINIYIYKAMCTYVRNTYCKGFNLRPVDPQNFSLLNVSGIPRQIDSKLSFANHQLH